MRVNGLDALALTKLDVLDGLAELQICTAYRCDGATLTEFPGDVAQLAACEPVYETMPGWSAPTAGVRRYADLPRDAQRYVARLEESDRRARRHHLDRLGARRHDHPRRLGRERAGSSRASYKPLIFRAELVDRRGVGVGELDTGAVRGGSFGFGSSNFAHAMAPRKRITNSSFGMLTRTF